MGVEYITLQVILWQHDADFFVETSSNLDQIKFFFLVYHNSLVGFGFGIVGNEQFGLVPCTDQIHVDILLLIT